jgi:phosphonate metabolism protein PhnN/1,5-bisphosphokinase (PRPP-forming)
MTVRGTLILIVGPSGVGKDSLIAGAAERFRDDPRIVFARRLITRREAGGGENHRAVSPTEFAAWRDAGRLMLHWRAHGLNYGLPQELAAALEQGRSVVANVSRAIVAEARHRFPPVAVVAVSASPEALAARLANRGRENAAEIGSRLMRAGAWSSDQADLIIDNNGPLDAAIGRFIALLRELAGQTASL